MNEESINLSVRQFLKSVGVKSQHQIEQAVSKAIASGKLSGKKSFPASMRLQIDAIGLDARFDGMIELE